MTNFRPSVAEIDLAALRFNFQQIRAVLHPADRILAVVKADAYGHGAVKVAQALAAEPIAGFGVATIEEGLELAEAGIRRPILVMDGLMGRGETAADAIIHAGLIPVIHSAEALAILESAARRRHRQVSVHIKIDSGMTRLGIRPESLPQLGDVARTLSHVRVEGLMTHLADAYDPVYTAHQLRIFRDSCCNLLKYINKIDVWHVANSAAISRGQLGEAPMADGVRWVRPGILLYGAPPSVTESIPFSLQPIMTIKSRIMLIKNIPIGTKVSYDCIFESREPMRIGVVPIGYADGYRLAFSNQGEVVVGGRRVGVIGRVTMDLIMIDLTRVPEAKIGSEVVLLGREGNAEITAVDQARWAGTIPYEILCGISKRIPRVYIS